MNANIINISIDVENNCVAVIKVINNNVVYDVIDYVKK